MAQTIAIDIDQCLRQDLLYRLQWDLSSTVEDVEIAAGPHDQTVKMPFLSHSLADESLFDPPLSCIEQVNIRDLADKEDRDIYYPVEERYKPPAALKIENEDGSRITLRQFVTELHAYVHRNMAEIKRAKGEMYGEPVTHADGTQGRNITCGRPVKLPKDVGVFFDMVMPAERDDGIWLRVSLWAEGERTYPKGFWAHRLSMIRVYEEIQR
jgi:hypothetical protein